MDDGESPKRQDFELECENGGKRDWCEAVSVDGNGSVVETLALHWTLLDREMQHKCSECHQRTSAQLGRTCCQNELLGDLREGLEMSVTSVVVEIEKGTSGQDRIPSRSKSTDGRTQCRRRYP